MIEAAHRRLGLNANGSRQELAPAASPEGMGHRLACFEFVPASCCGSSGQDRLDSLPQFVANAGAATGRTDRFPESGGQSHAEAR